MENYNKKLQDFVQMIARHQNERLVAQGMSRIADTFAYAESGRKFDKVIISNGNSHSVRYFVERKTGAIYGSRSRLAPNLKWYFGTLDRIELWNWGDFHGVPIHDDHVRVVGQYAGYVRYMEV